MTMLLAARPGVAVLLLALAMADRAGAQSLVGRWDARVGADSTAIAFPLEIMRDSGGLAAVFFNGQRRVMSTRTTVSRDTAVFHFDHLGTVLVATMRADTINASYGTPGRGRGQVIVAEPHRETANTAGPDIAGVWVLPARSAKGEAAWRLIVRQEHGRTAATILRVDGDAGLHEGSWSDSVFSLGLFDGSRSGRLDLLPRPDGKLTVRQRNSRGSVKEYLAVRADRAVAEGVPLPADFATHTRLRDPDARFRFSFPDLHGRIVSDSDSQFRGKVVIVNIAGSWCPNCHDEAPFLAELYRTWHGRGLEIVSLAFEEKDQLADPVRLRAFLAEYRIDYTCLLAGEPSELTAKLPQAEGLDSWPTTFFIGRDGKVRAIHAGFAAEASGEFHLALRAEMTATIERLLAEPRPSDTSGGPPPR